ncbi:hypothetical protein STEG23_008202 [Scotinomys teguina]
MEGLERSWQQVGNQAICIQGRMMKTKGKRLKSPVHHTSADSGFRFAAPDIFSNLVKLLVPFEFPLDDNEEVIVSHLVTDAVRPNHQGYPGVASSPNAKETLNLHICIGFAVPAVWCLPEIWWTGTMSVQRRLLIVPLLLLAVLCSTGTSDPGLS